jgi:hypothetical protein
MSAVHPLFDLAALTTSPFPSDRFTVADTAQNTGRRVNLPLPDLITHPSDREDTQVLNTLDGFNMQPRLSIPFDGPIDVNTVNSQDVFLVSMGDTLDSHEHGGQVVGINQVVWDVATNTLHAESNDLLDQHTRYALIVTNGVHDASGHPVEATLAFRLAPLTLALSHDPVLRNYGLEMVEGLVAASRAGVRVQDIAIASVFTTESATAILEKIRDQIHLATPDAAVFNLGPDGARTVFSLDQVTGITFNQQRRTDGPLTPVSLNDPDLTALNYIPGAVSEIAFGKYSSADYEVHTGPGIGNSEFIPPVGTRTGIPVVQGTNEVYFNLFLPSGPKPESGWPVAIFGHGNGKDKNDSFLVAATLAEHGIATIAINLVGNGFGPLGTLTVNSSAGDPVTFAAGGRGIDQIGNNQIGNNEGLSATSPRTILSDSDGIRQTAADLMQLVRVIEVGMDVHGDGQSDLDPSRIYFVGHSLGANYGTVFLAVEPNVGAGVLNAASANSLANQELIGRGNIGMLLGARTPPLLNSPGLMVFGGRTITQPWFDENMPLRNGIPLPVTDANGTMRIIQSPVTNTVAGAVEIQELLDNAAWASQDGSPVAYAPHLRKAPLTGVAAKSVIYQFNYGDQLAPNPTTTAVLRAGDLADRTTFYRHDLAYAEDHLIPLNPHPALISPTSTDLLFATVARGYQRQIANFFASDGQFVDDLADVTTPDGTALFEVPIAGPLPEDLNFILASPPAPAPASASRVSGPNPTVPPGGSPPVSDLFMALQLGGMPAGPGAVTAASGRLSLQLLALNSLNPDPWRVKEPTQADEVSHGASRAPALTDVFDHVFADRDDSWLQDMFGDDQTAARVG